MVQRAGLPWPRALVRLNGAIMLTCGLLVVSGRSPRTAVALLGPTLVTATVVGHPFWNETDQAKRRDHEIHWMKNLGLLGGLILLVARDPADFAGHLGDERC